MVKKVDNPFHGQPNSKPHHQTKNNKRKVFIIGGIIAIGVFFLNSYYDEDYDVHLETTKNKSPQINMSQDNANGYTPSFQQDMTSLATSTIDTNSFVKNNEGTDAGDGSISADPDGEQDEANDADGDKDSDGSQAEDPVPGTDATGTDAEDSTSTVAGDTEAKDAVDGQDKADADGEAKNDVNDQEKPEEKKDPHLYVKEEQTPDLNEKKPADPNAVNNMDEGYYQKMNSFKAANGVNQTVGDVNATAAVLTEANATVVNTTTVNSTLAGNATSANSTTVSVNAQGNNGTAAGNKIDVVDSGNSTKTDSNVTVVAETPQTTASNNITTASNNITTVSNDTLVANTTTTITNKASSMSNETSTTATSATNTTDQTITVVENKEDKNNTQTTNSTESSVRSTMKDGQDKPEETTTNTEDSKEEKEKVLLELCKSDIFGESFEQSFDELQQKLDECLESKNMGKIQTVDNVDVNRQDTEDSAEGTTKKMTHERKFLRGVRFLQEEDIQNTAENNTEPEGSTIPTASCKSDESSVLLSGLCGGQLAKDKSNSCEYYVAYGGTTPDDLTAKTAFEVLAENSNCNVNVVPLCSEDGNAKLSSEALIGDRAIEESVKSRIFVVADTCLEAKELSSRDDPTEDTSEGIVAKPAPLETELLYIDLTGSAVTAAAFLRAIEGERLHLVHSDVEKDIKDIYLPKQIVFTGEDEKIILDNDLQLKLMNMGYIVVEPNIGPLSLIRVKCPKAPASIGGSASFVTAGFPMR